MGLTGIEFLLAVNTLLITFVMVIQFGMMKGCKRVENKLEEVNNDNK